MWSGRETLLSIEHTLDQVREQERALDDQVEAGSTENLRLGQQEAHAYRRLASIRLDAIESGAIAETIDAASARVAEILEQRRQARSRLEEDTGATRARLAELATEREQALAVVDRASAALDHGEAATQARLAEDDGYRALLEEARRADAVADHAEDKTARAEQDRTEKGRPYDADPLFLYLWRRGHGTSVYRASRLITMLDGWVARLCRFHAARPNYAMLQELPRRLGEHAARARATADHALEALAAHEEVAAAEDGLPALRTALEDARARLDEVDAAIHAQEEALNALIASRQAFAAGRDPHGSEAVDTLVGAFRGERLGVLRDLAAATPSPDDDRIVAELVEIDEHRDALALALERDRQMQERAALRVRQLEEIRDRFTRNRYDGLHSTFDHGQILGMMLARYAEGIATAEDLWQTIEDSRRLRRIESDPGFGTGGIGRRRRSTWHWPGPRGGGGFGGGGFRTGGSFGGGGFRTGGGF